jgi:tRNA dimethylallyltransferase
MSDSDDTDLPLIPAIVGATAIGKTSVALELAENFNLEIVSCDSRQIYKYLDIGTAKPTESELQGRAYHLIDFVEPDRLFSAAHYREEAHRVMQQVFARGHRPLVVGGTGLYLKALISGFFSTPEPDMDYRKQLEKLPPEAIHRRLRELDPSTAAEVPVGNKVRAMRALEIVHLTGKAKSALMKEGNYPGQKYRYILFGLSCSRQKLYQFINSRVDKMIEDGLLAEVENLCENGYRNSPVLKSTLGYRELLAYLNGELNLEVAVDLIKRKTRNYAKRQLTWFRKTEGLIDVDTEAVNAAEILSERLNKFNLDTLS